MTIKRVKDEKAKQTKNNPAIVKKAKQTKNNPAIVKKAKQTKTI